jgi:hypothetical protein
MVQVIKYEQPKSVKDVFDNFSQDKLTNQSALTKANILLVAT